MAFLMKDTDVASIYTTWCCQGKNESPKTSVSYIFYFYTWLLCVLCISMNACIKNVDSHGYTNNLSKFF